MTFTFEEEEYTLPNSLSEISLQTHIDWIINYGAELSARKIAAELEIDMDVKNLNLHLIFIDEATKAFSHYTGIPLATVETSIELSQILNAYTVTQILLAVESRGVEIQPTYDWKGDTWAIGAVDLGTPSGLTREQFRTIKKLAEYVIALSEGDWTKMPYICAAYFRLDGEPFNPDYLNADNTRFLIMAELPMDIAIAVATYLQSSLSIYTEVIANHIYEEAPEIADQPSGPIDPIEAPVPEA